jgi:hypothetical protein
MVCPHEAELVTADSAKGGRPRLRMDDKSAASLAQSVACPLCASELHPRPQIAPPRRSPPSRSPRSMSCAPFRFLGDFLGDGRQSCLFGKHKCLILLGAAG